MGQITIQEMDSKSFGQLWLEPAQDIFYGQQWIFEPVSVMTEEEKLNSEKVRGQFGDTLRINLAAFDGDKFVGWCWGYQQGIETFYISNSAVLAAFRNQGIYSLLLKKMVEKVSAMGFQRIKAKITLTNNAALIPKLKEGFQISSMEVNDRLGATLHLVYYTNDTRRKVFHERACGKPEGLNQFD